MRTTIDRAGRVVVPKAMRDRLGLGNGGDVEVVEHDGVIEISPAPATVIVRETPQGLVFDTVEDVPPLTDEMVRAAIDAGRR